MKKSFVSPRTNIIACEMTGTILTGSIETFQIDGPGAGGKFS